MIDSLSSLNGARGGSPLRFPVVSSSKKIAARSRRREAGVFWPVPIINRVLGYWTVNETLVRHVLFNATTNPSPTLYADYRYFEDAILPIFLSFISTDCRNEILFRKRRLDQEEDVEEFEFSFLAHFIDFSRREEKSSKFRRRRVLESNEGVRILWM